MGEPDIDLQSDALHLRLDVLYKSADLENIDKAKVHIDPRTWDLIRWSRAAHRDNSIDFNRMDQAEWRRLPVILHHYTDMKTYTSEANDNPSEGLRHPFCMYIEAVKENGRIFYVDDPQTDNNFL